MKQKLKHSKEWDWVSKKARSMINWNAGVGKAIKKALNKRARREGKP